MGVSTFLKTFLQKIEIRHAHGMIEGMKNMLLTGRVPIAQLPQAG